MQRTRQEIATRALRMIGVTAEDEPPSADQMAAALAVLDGLWGELLAEVRPTWDIVTGTPAEGFVPLASWLAAELATEYERPVAMSRSRAKLRLLAVVRPDDRVTVWPRDDYGLTIWDGC